MPTLSERLFKLATENAGSYLVSLNLKAISKDRKRSPTDDPRAFYENLRKEAEDGPIFSKPVIEALHLCPVELQKHEVQWLATQYEAARKAKPSAKFPDVQELRGVLDYLHQETPNLDTLTWAQAVKNSAEWHKSFVREVPMGKYETKDVVMEFDNGWSMVKVPTEHDLDVEGEFMGHCVGGDDYARKVSKGKCTIYSLRDPKNEPHVTIEVAEPHPKKGTPNPRVEREVIQVQGKQNEAPIEKYHGMLEKFFVREGLHLQDETSGYIRDIEVLRGMVRSSDLSEIRRAAANSYLTPELAEDIYRKVLPLASKTPPLRPLAERTHTRANARNRQTPTRSSSSLRTTLPLRPLFYQPWPPQRMKNCGNKCLGKARSSRIQGSPRLLSTLNSTH